MYYYLPEPPYFLLIVGLFTGITCGLAFEASLKLTLKQWSKQSSRKSLEELRAFKVGFPFVGICLGVCVFLASGLQIFSLDVWLSYGISLLMTIFIGGLVWYQLGNLFLQLQRGGSRELDLDAFEL